MYLHQHLHFVGIGGVGMAGIAEVLINHGYTVTGSDLKPNSLISHLESLGAKIFLGHSRDNVPEETHVVVYSSAIVPTNPELEAAHERNIPIIPRAEMLGELMRMKYGIAIAGAHGKTTTTSMCAKILSDIGLDPTVIIGGRVLSQLTGARVGTGAYLVAEADESDGSFCMLRPAISVVTNIDYEHMSHYKTFQALEDAFLSFMRSVPFYGLIVACGDDPVVNNLTTKVKRRVVRYGLSPSNDIYATDIALDGPYSSFTVNMNGAAICEVRLPMTGSHMVSNSLAAIAVAFELGAYPEEVARALGSFSGVARRTEVVSNENGILILDDYAHHPREIEATLAAIKSGWLPHQARELGIEKPGRLVVMFQPHRFTRTKELFADFLRCFGAADFLYIADIYPAGEEAIPGITSESLASAIDHPQVTYCGNPFTALTGIAAGLSSGDVMVTLGAGSIGKCAHELGVIISERNIRAIGGS